MWRQIIICINLCQWMKNVVSQVGCPFSSPTNSVSALNRIHCTDANQRKLDDCSFVLYGSASSARQRRHPANDTKAIATLWTETCTSSTRFLRHLVKEDLRIFHQMQSDYPSFEFFSVFIVQPFGYDSPPKINEGAVKFSAEFWAISPSPRK